MIELTDQQLKALNVADAKPLRLVDPRTNQSYVLLRVDEYERLSEQSYDDTEWTREELQSLAWEISEGGDWEEYDDAVEKS